MFAAEKGHTKAVEALIAAGAELNLQVGAQQGRRGGNAYHVQKKDGWNAIMLAAANGRTGAVGGGVALRGAQLRVAFGGF